MNGPHTYAEWVVRLDQFGAGDDTCLEAMQCGSIEWTNVVAQRWTRQVSEALAARLRALSKQLQTGLDRAGGDAVAISTALLGVRRGLGPLRTFGSLSSFPEVVQTHLRAELDRWASQTQQSLEHHALQVRHDQGQLLKTIRDHPLQTVAATGPAPAVAQTNQDANPPVRGRRILL